MATSKKLTQQQAMQDLQAKSHEVAPDTAAGMVKKFKGFKTKLTKALKAGDPVPAGSPEFPLCLTYNAKAILKLLKKPGCVGLRIYPAINADNSFTVVMVGVNETGDNMIEAAPATKKAAGKISAKNATGPTSPKGTLDEGQTSPPYPAPGGGGL